MNAINITSTAILSLLLGIAAPAYAQHEDEKQDHPQQQESQHEQARPQQQHAQQQQRQDQSNRQQHAQQQERQNQSNRQQHAQQQPRQDQNNRQQHAQQQERQDQSNRQQQAQRRGNERPQRSQEQQRIQQSAWQEHRSPRWDSNHRNWQQRGGYNGYRIPDDRYRGYFGRNHGFRIYGLPFLVVGGYPRFQYEGYWISLVDPWPEYWGNDWYDNDDVYVTYADNGYYLYNQRYPNVGIAIRISM